MSSAFHPQTDGQSEVVNSTILDLLKAYVHDQQTKWEKFLPMLQFAYNNTRHSATGRSPNEILLGEPLPIPIFQMKDKVFSADSFTSDWKLAFEQVKEHIAKSQEKYCKAANKKRKKITFKVGNFVWLKFDKKRLKKPNRNLKIKLSFRYYGPFCIEKVINEVSFRLTLPSHWKMHNVFHASLLKPLREPCCKNMLLKNNPKSLMRLKW